MTKSLRNTVKLEYGEGLGCDSWFYKRQKIVRTWASAAESISKILCAEPDYKGSAVELSGKILRELGFRDC